MIGFRLPNGQQIELAPGASISLEINNALLADAENNGSYTLPVTAPRTPNNELVLQFAGLLDSPSGSNRRIESVQAFDDDQLLAIGTLLLLKVTATAFELSLQTGISALMAKLKSHKLRDFVFGGQRTVSAATFGSQKDAWEGHMNDVAANPQNYDYVFAPVSNNDFIDDNPENWVRRININSWSGGTNIYGTPGFVWSSGYFLPSNIVPGVQVTLFPGYYPEHQQSCVPFPRLGYVVRTMLQELNIAFEEDFFDEETEQLVMIGNTPIDDLRTNSDVKTLDYNTVGLTFRIGDVLADLTPHELLRKLADTFFLDLSSSPIGVLRIRRSNRLLAAPPAVDLTAKATPGYTMDVPAEEAPGLATTYLTEHDGYSGSRYKIIDEQMRGQDVATLADLVGGPDFEHEIRLVLSIGQYYQHNGTIWEFFSIALPTVTVGPAGERATPVPQGIELLLEEEMQTEYLVPLPGGEWPPNPNNGVVPFAMLRACIFGERGYSPSVNALTRSTALRLGFYRGMKPFKLAAQGSFPLLTQANVDMQGNRLGNYTLRLDGPDGTVARWGQAILEARRAANEPVTWPVWLTADEINQLDMGHRIEIDGIHFLVKKINVTFPIRRAAELQLVVLRPKANLQ